MKCLDVAYDKHLSLSCSLGLSWAGTSTTGHTKRITLMSACVVAASVANMISPEYVPRAAHLLPSLNPSCRRFWQSKYAPRYRLPWAFMTAFWFISPAMCIIIRFYLQRENRCRARLLAEKGGSIDEVYGELDTGSQKIRVEDHDMDLTDRENLKFVYPL